MTHPAQLAAGLEAQDWRETASITGDWRRFGKFGRGAYYIILHDCRLQHRDRTGPIDLQLRKGELWFGPLHRQWPEMQVVGPILDQILAQGRVDSQALLIELLDVKPTRQE